MAIDFLWTNQGLAESQKLQDNAGWKIFPRKFGLSESTGTLDEDRTSGDPWQESTSYAEGQFVVPTDISADPFYFKALNSGTSGASEPTWPTTEGDTVVDGDITWENQGTSSGGLETRWVEADISSVVEFPPESIEVVLSVPPETTVDDKSIGEIYILAENEDEELFLLAMGQPTESLTYTPTSTTTIRITLTITNQDISGSYTFNYTQSTEIEEHTTDPNAHEDIRGLLRPHENLVRNSSFQVLNSWATDEDLSDGNFHEATPKNYEGRLVGTTISGTLTRSTAPNVGDLYSLRFDDVTISGGARDVEVRYRVPSWDARRMAGNAASFRYRVWHNTTNTETTSVSFYAPTSGVDDFDGTLNNFHNSIGFNAFDSTDNLIKVENFSVPADAENGIEVVVTFTAGADFSNQDIEFAEFKLEQGSNSTDYRAETYYEELGRIHTDVVDKSAYDVVVGTATQVQTGRATHTVSDFVSALSANDKVLLLDGTHTLVRNEDITVSNVILEGQSDEAVLDFSTFSLTVSGAGCWIDIQTSGAGSGDIVLSGVGTMFVSKSLSRTAISASDGVLAFTTGTNGGLVLPGDGTAAAPAIAFSGEQGTGFYRIGGGNIGITLSGVLEVNISASTFQLVNAALNAQNGGTLGGTFGGSITWSNRHLHAGALSSDFIRLQRTDAPADQQLYGISIGGTGVYQLLTRQDDGTLGEVAWQIERTTTTVDKFRVVNGIAQIDDSTTGSPSGGALDVPNGGARFGGNLFSSSSLRLGLASAPTLGADESALYTADYSGSGTGALKSVTEDARDAFIQLMDEKAQPDGYASLDSNGDIPIDQIPNAAGSFDFLNDCLLYLDLDNGIAFVQGVGSVSFSRGSTASYVDRYGVLKEADVDEPRHEKSGLLLEGENTNGVRHSNDFGDSVWTKTNSSITSDNATGPDDVSGSADKLFEDSTSSAIHSVSQYPYQTPADNTVYTASIFAKSAERSWLRLVITRKDGSEAGAYFDVANGVIGTTVNESLVEIEKVDDFYRCKLSADILANDTEAFNLGSAVYDEISFDLSAQDGTPQDLKWNNDGTKLYMVGASNDNIYQYTASTPFDISTLNYDGVSLDVSTEDTTPTGIAWNDDGSKLYMVGTGNDSIYQYSASTPFDLSTVSYDTVSLDVSTEDTAPTGIAWNDDGSKLYMTGNTNTSIYQYSASTPFDLSTVSYDTVSLDVSLQGDTVDGVTWNNDGTKLFTVNDDLNRIDQYVASTPFDLSTVSYDSVHLSVDPDNNPKGMDWNDDGTKLYVSGIQNDSVYQYTLSAVDFGIRLADSDGGETYNGDGSSGVYIHGAQWEELTFASSYISTEGSAVIRSADGLSMTINGNVPLQADDQSILISAKLLGDATVGQVGFSVVGETAREFSLTNNRELTYGDAVIGWGGSVNAGTQQIYGVTFDGTTVRAYLNGSEAGSDATVDATDSLGTALHIGQDVNNEAQVYGHIRKVRIYDRALTADEMTVA